MYSTSLFLIGFIVGYTIRGIFDQLNDALAIEYSIVDGC
jgi:hypothetical protein